MITITSNVGQVWNFWPTDVQAISYHGPLHDKVQVEVYLEGRDPIKFEVRTEAIAQEFVKKWAEGVK